MRGQGGEGGGDFDYRDGAAAIVIGAVENFVVAGGSHADVIVVGGEQDVGAR